MMRHLAAGFIAFSLVTAANAQAPTSKELKRTSWGKPGVSFEDYRMDAGICAWRATNKDIADTEAAKTMVKASRALDHQSSTMLSYTNTAGVHTIGGVGIDSRNVIDRYRVDKQFDAIEDIQYQALFDCLEERGYRRFQLTDEQAKALRKFKAGSLQRHSYLYSLASDSEVLEKQAL